MKNQSQAGAKRPAKTLHNQSAKPGAIPDKPKVSGASGYADPNAKAAQTEGEYREVAVSELGEILFCGSDGNYYVTTKQNEFFDGQKWRQYTSSAELHGAGIPSREDDPRKRVRKVDKPLSQKEVRAWVLNNCVPFEFHPMFAPPFDRAYKECPDVQEAAQTMHLDPDAVVCYAVQVFLEYVAEFPDQAEKVGLYHRSNVEQLMGERWQATPGAMVLFARLLKEALNAPGQESVSRLAALRDLASPHPSFYMECSAIARMLGEARNLSDLESHLREFAGA